jgi:hypothetical protein
MLTHPKMIYGRALVKKIENSLETNIGGNLICKIMDPSTGSFTGSITILNQLEFIPFAHSVYIAIFLFRVSRFWGSYFFLA